MLQHLYADVFIRGFRCVMYNVSDVVLTLCIFRMERHILTCLLLLHLNTQAPVSWKQKILQKEQIWFLHMQRNWIAKDTSLLRTLLRVHQILILHLLHKYSSTGEERLFFFFYYFFFQFANMLPRPPPPPPPPKKKKN
jgi:hypothetical protein